MQVDFSVGKYRFVLSLFHLVDYSAIKQEGLESYRNLFRLVVAKNGQHMFRTYLKRYPGGRYRSRLFVGERTYRLVA